MGFLAAQKQSLDMLHKSTHKWLCQHATACLGNRFNPLCHDTVAPLQANHSGLVSSDNFYHPPSKTTDLLCYHLYFSASLDTVCFSPKISADLQNQDILSSSFLPPTLSGNSYSQLLVLMQLHLSSPLPKETILERRKAKRQWLRQLTQTSSIIRVADIAYIILQCLKIISFVSVVMQETEVRIDAPFFHFQIMKWKQ